MINSPFTRFAKKTSTYTGRPATFVIAVLIIVVWACTGPLIDYSDTWQLVINTGTTIITFLMVFLIQNTQNRDTEALDQAGRDHPMHRYSQQRTPGPRGDGRQRTGSHPGRVRGAGEEGASGS